MCIRDDIFYYYLQLSDVAIYFTLCDFKKNGIETLLRHLIGVGHFNGMVFLLYFKVYYYLGLQKCFLNSVLLHV